MTIRIGITCIGSGIGQSVISSCNLSSLPLYTVGFDYNPFAFGRFECNEFESVPHSSDPFYIDTLLSICEKKEISLLIPGLDSELVLLAENADRFRSKGTEVLIAEHALIQLCRDKLRISNYLNERSTAFIKTFDRRGLATAWEKGELNYPLIAKPRSGSASAGVFIINDMQAMSKVSEEQVVQEIIFPRKEDINYAKYVEDTAKIALRRYQNYPCNT